MRRIHHQHSVKAETHWTRLDVAYTRELKRRKNLPVCRAALNLARDLFKHAVSRRVLQQAHQWLDVGMKLHQFRRQLGFGRGDARQLGEEAEVTKTGECRSSRGA